MKKFLLGSVGLAAMLAGPAAMAADMRLPPPPDLGAKGDIVRARLTVKTQGYGFFWR